MLEESKTSPQEASQQKLEKTQNSTSLWAKLFKSPFFWLIFAIVALISIINYLERFTNVQVHNQYQIF